MDGFLKKMRYVAGDPLQVYLRVDDEELALNSLLGKQISLQHNGLIHCCHCSKKTSKSYGGGYCYRCFTKLPECDMCILKPETCHRAAGTCRNNAWSDVNCMRGHLVYLAFTSEVKVGITRGLSGLPRWYDQGAICARPLLRVPDRLAAGEVEVFLKQQFSDKTKWKQMLESTVSHAEAAAQLDTAYEQAGELLHDWLLEHQFDRFVEDSAVQQFVYPVAKLADAKLERLTLAKDNEISGKLVGVKGQYLLLDTGVINIRQHVGFHVVVS